MVYEIRHVSSEAPVIRAILEQISDRHCCMTEARKTKFKITNFQDPYL